jgi:hypothetical protein
LIREVAIRVVAPPHGRATFDAIAEVVAHHRGEHPVSMVLELHEAGCPVRVMVDLPRARVRPSADLVDELERICGAGSVELR